MDNAKFENFMLGVVRWLRFNSHNSLHIQSAKAIEKNIFEIEINIHWTITALDDINLVYSQWIDRYHVYVSPTIFQCSHIRIYDIGYTVCITLMASG